MKQTKPFGMPCVYEKLVLSNSKFDDITKPGEIGENSSELPPDRKNAEISYLPKAAVSLSCDVNKVETLNVGTNSGVFSRQKLSKSGSFPAILRTLAWTVVLIPVALTGYVLMRDSFLVIKNISFTSSDESVMTCASGYVSYPDGGIRDVVLGNGTFTCTNWKTHKRYTVLPNGVNFAK